MTVTIWHSDKLRSSTDWKQFTKFVQQQANRLAFGHPRYEAKIGGPSKHNRYMTRLTMELRAYRRNGNREHLLNIANYAYLESQAPENKKAHYDPLVCSATRRDFEGD